MHLIFVSWWWPYPANNGSKIRIYNLLRQLAGVHEVTLLSFAEPDEAEPDEIAHMRTFCRRVESFPNPHAQPGKIEAIRGYLAPWPRSMVYNYTLAVTERIREIVKIDKIDLIIASQVDMLRYLDAAPSIPAILEEVELTYYLNRIEEAGGAGRFRVQLTLDKLAGALRTLHQRGVRFTVASDSERANIQRIISPDIKPAVILNGVDTQTHQPSNVTPQPSTMIYPGAVTYSANHDAVAYFIHDILPLIRRQKPQAQFTVTGKTDSVDVSDLKAQPGVVFSGYLPSVDDAVRQSWATVVPLRIGGGTRLKILESMALGTPVVSTRKGAEGLNVEAGNEILIADTPDEMAKMLCNLFERADLRAKMAAAARKRVEQEYDWTVIGRQLLNFIEEIVQKR
jgi:glycosyltransferase involved in cell wall biosynthesis